MQKITKKTELATTLRIIAKYCENSGCEILSWYNPAYELANDINQCSPINRYSGDIILATNSMPTMVDKINYVKEHKNEIIRIIKIASERINLEPLEIIMLSILYTSKCSFSVDDITNFFNISKFDVIDIYNINSDLTYKGYLYVSSPNTWALIYKIRNLINENSKEITPVPFSRERLIHTLGRLVCNYERDDKSLYETLQINENLLPNDEFIKILKEKFIASERLLIYSLLYQTETSLDYKWLLSDVISNIYNEYSTIEQRSLLERFMDGTQPLVIEGFVEIVPNEYNEFEPMISLSDKCAELYFGDTYDGYAKRLEASMALKNKSAITIKSDTIKEKVLYYNNENKSDIEFLYKSMDDNNLTQLKQRLEKHNLPNGICAILYGAPGTGKTETVMQIARECKRDIYHVDIAESKSMWFGESEKKIKKIFTTYQSLCQKARNLGNNLPILLFNEADSIFSKRKDVTVGSVAQTENTMQNILLEEMEKLDGILIATTNLIDNLDPAFERRFLFKVKLDKPSVENKMKIWANKVEGLKEPQYRKLAEQFDFSGGEIENVARKIIMQDVLYGKLPEFDRILEFCKAEKLSSSKNTIIGFRNS